jgi:hypothetical protein
MRRLIHGCVVFIAFFLVAGCAPERTNLEDRSYVEKIPKHPNIIVKAPRELIGASLMIDGSDRRMLWPDTLIRHTRSSFWSRLLRPDRPASTAAIAYLELPQGRHVLAISQKHYRTIIKTIDVSSKQQQVSIAAAELTPENGGAAGP